MNARHYPRDIAVCMRNRFLPMYSLKQVKSMRSKSNDDECQGENNAGKTERGLGVKVLGVKVLALF